MPASLTLPKTADIDEEKDEDLGAAEHEPVATKFPLDIRKAEFSVFELHRRWHDGTLRIQPDFQRAFVWSEEKQIKLIESVFAKIPLPVIYLSDDDEKLEVVDGQQRLTTLFAFIEGRFAASGPEEEHVILRRGADPGHGRAFELRNLRLLGEFKGLTFGKLDPKTRRKFEETQLTCFILNPTISPQAKFELFERINEGATPLTPQEIRNALLQGPGLELVRRLAAPKGRFRQVAGPKRSYARMRADELVLRGVAFAWLGWEDYKGDLQVFLNDSLAKLNKANDAERADVEQEFLHGVDFAERVFGDHAWQRFDTERKDDKNHGWSGHISGPLVEVVSTAAKRVFPSSLPSENKTAKIRTKFEKLCGEQSFSNAILTATQTVKSVKTRMEAFERICRDA